MIHSISRTEITQHTISLVNQILNTQSEQTKNLKIEQLNKHLMVFPASRMVAVQVN